jgi:hypothetical protein
VVAQARTFKDTMRTFESIDDGHEGDPEPHQLWGEIKQGVVNTVHAATRFNRPTVHTVKLDHINPSQESRQRTTVRDLVALDRIAGEQEKS